MDVLPEYISIPPLLYHRKVVVVRIFQRSYAGKIFAGIIPNYLDNLHVLYSVRGCSKISTMFGLVT